MECPQCGNPNREEARFCDSCGTPLERSQPGSPGPAGADHSGHDHDELPGLIADRFEPSECLGRRGAKTVYRAHDRERAEDVALAVFDSAAVSAGAQAQARREAQATERVGEHPNVVSVIGAGDWEGSPWIASEYMAGGDLRADIEGLSEESVPLERAIKVATDVLKGLGHIHTKGIVHRDLKPASVWLDEDGTARLGDFGLAVTGAGETGLRGVVGTAAYLPPEQALGRPTDARADLYSLGCLLYELVAGTPPFSGDDAVAIISQHLSAEPTPVSAHREGVTVALDEALAQLLAKDPAERPANAKAAMKLLSGALEGELAEVGGKDDGDGLGSLASGVFVGREPELERLRGSVDELAAGRGGLVLLVGEPGIGKTRTAEELATYAALQGAQVHWGRCHEDEAAPAYWPWAEALRAYAEASDPVGLRWALGAAADDVARIAPGVAKRIGVEPDGSEAPAGGDDRFRIFDSVTRFLIGAASAKPLVLILEDLHWADETSLLLLRFVARNLRDSQLLIVGTYRDVELGRHHSLADTLGGLAREEIATRVALHGLGAEAVERLIRRTIGRPPPPGLAALVAERTEGNPFFAGEVVRLMAAEGSFDAGSASIAIPEGVRDVVGRRLDRLGPEANEVLRVAAATGREFLAEVVADAAGKSEQVVAKALASAGSERLVNEPGSATTHHSFAHALVRETLYAEIPGGRRPTVHQAIGLALESRCGDEGGVELAELGHHFSEAAAAGEAARAVDYCDRAAAEAESKLAHEDAVAHLSAALDAYGLLADPEPERELGIRLRLGAAQTRAGRFVDARVTLLGAARRAAEVGDTGRQVEATLGVADLSPEGYRDDEIASLVGEALEAVGPEPSGERAKLLAALAHEEYWPDTQGIAAPMIDEALAMAREVGDRSAEAMALALSTFVIFGPDGATRRLSDADQLLELGRESGDGGSEIRAHAYRITALLELGRIDEVDAAIEDFREAAERLREPRHLWHVPLMKATRAVMRGEFAAAKTLAAEALAGSERAQEPLGIQFNVIQRTMIHYAEGTVEEMLPFLRRMTEQYPSIPAWRMSLVSFLCEAGRADEAREDFELLAAADFEDIPHNLIWLGSMCRMADATCDLADERRGAILYRMLKDFSGLIAVIGRAAAVQGPVDLYVGRLASLIGRHDDAIRHLRAAIELSERTGERSALAQCRRRLGEALLARGGEGDTATAIEVLAGAIDLGQELGMRRVVERALDARLRAQGVEISAVGDPIDDVIEALGDSEAAEAGGGEPVAIVFSDIESSTLMTERLGDERWLEVLRAHNDIFRSRLLEHRGTEIKNQGDGFMLAFADPADALACAIGVQRDLAGLEVPEDERVRVRMGMHWGEAIEQEGDYFGRSVILAARIAAQARGGEVLVSADTREAAGEDFEFCESRELELKGLAGFHAVHVADWEAEPVAA